jgi:hypothetical protein
MAASYETLDEERHESPLEQLDRNTGELLQELRVAGTGVQVVLAFLLIMPFNQRFTRLTSFERYDYFVTLLCVATAAVLLLSPSIHHRLLFRRVQKPFLVGMGSKLMIVGMGFLCVGFTGVLVLISHVMWGGTTATIVGVATALFVIGVWFGVPLHRRRYS